MFAYSYLRRTRLLRFQRLLTFDFILNFERGEVIFCCFFFSVVAGQLYCNYNLVEVIYQKQKNVTIYFVKDTENT